MGLSTARRGLLSIVGGTAGGQVIALLCAPLISRLFPPTEYGPFAIVNAAILPLATVAALRLDLAIPVPDDDDEALRLASLGLRLVAAFGATFAAIAWFFRGRLVDSLHLQMDPTLLVWIPVVAALMGAFMVLNQVAIRWQMYGAIGRRNILQATVVSLAQISAGAAGWGAHGLALGLAVGQLAGVLSLVSSVRGRVPRVKRDSATSDSSMLRRYKSFPLLMAPSGLLNALGLQAPVLLMAALYGSAVAGWLGMTQRILSLPIALVGVALSQVYLGEFSAAKRAGSIDLKGLFMRASARLAAAGVGLALGLIVLAPTAFALVLGEQWRVSGDYARALAVASALQLVASPLSQTLIVMGRLKTQAAWDCARLFLCVVTVWAAHHMGESAQTSILWLGGAMTISYAVSWMLSRRSLNDVRGNARPLLF